MNAKTLEAVEKAVLHHPDPFVTAPDVAEYLTPTDGDDETPDVSRRSALEALAALEYSGPIHSKETGARSVAWWHQDRVNRAPPKDPADHPDQAGFDDVSERARSRAPVPTDRPTSRTFDGTDATVDALADWQPGRSRDERKERRTAGVSVLEWLRDRDAPARRADVVAELYDSVSINGQSEDTFWRKVARPALKHAADRGYVTIDAREYRWSA